ncbi:MAG: glycosyltransferase family 4 protein [Deltaproteobacteria bacterium]
MSEEFTTTAEPKIRNKEYSPEMLEIVNIINVKKPRAMILYLIPEHGEPQPELIDLLIEMASRGYLCFLCQPSYSGGLEAWQENLFLVRHGFLLIPVIKSLSAIILTTQSIHPDWAEMLHHKFLWLHLDTDYLTDTMERKIDQADLISYFPATSLTDLKPPVETTCVCLQSNIDYEFNANLIEESIKFVPRGWLPYANLDLRGKVAVMTATFLNFTGDYFYNGGAERYLLDLSEICAELGSELVVFQYGNYPWVRHFKNIHIISLSRYGSKAEGLMLRCAKEFNHVFYQLVQGRTALNIYSAFFEIWPLAATPNIGISHGVSWDTPFCEFEHAAVFWIMNQRYIEAAKACEDLISVDTNSASWLQTVDFSLSQNIKLVPNYVDLSVFTPKEDYLENRDKIVILYPRQLYAARGLYLVLEIMDDILEEYPAVEFHFVGRGAGQDLQQVIDKQIKWADRVKYYPLSMDEMPQAYQAADISLIPTVHSEGTSLSCLEAMASGNAVIATRVGGLPDLIINNYNGFLIDPRPQELKQAIISLLEDREQLNLFKARNPEVARAFSKDRWQNSWRSLLENKMDGNHLNDVEHSRVVEIRLGDKPVDYRKLGDLITTLLSNGDLIYVRSHEEPDLDLSFARIQWLAPEAPLFAPCDLTIEL